MTESLIYSLTCYTFIITSVVCAVIRWCHVCRPYSEQREYYHPARRQVTFFLAAVVIQMPYVVRPMDADTWFFARTFGILYYRRSRQTLWGSCADANPKTCCQTIHNCPKSSTFALCIRMTI